MVVQENLNINKNIRLFKKPIKFKNHLDKKFKKYFFSIKMLLKYYSMHCTINVFKINY